MDKRRAIQIMTRAATLYHENLEDQKVILFMVCLLKSESSYSQKVRDCFP